MLRQTEIKADLLLRARIIQHIRTFFIQNGFLEVETPCRIEAPAPEAHIDALESGGRFLQTSPELGMKRLLAAGYPAIFQICKCFRKNERGSRHLPEFTMMEWYRAGYDYQDMMTQVADLISFVAGKLDKGSSLSFQGMHISLERPWPRLTVSEAFERYSPVSLETALDQDRFEELLVEAVEPSLDRTRPLFLYDYPARLGGLARLKSKNPAVAERFELYLGGLEICNAFTELTDAVEQRKRFLQEQQLRQNAGKTIYPLPERFLAALKHMPPATGNALGVDRLVMVLADKVCIDDVCAFIPEEI